jgi:hypothetical protein
MCHAVIERWWRDSVVSVAPEVPDEWVGDGDAMGRRLHAAADAFARLPERWRVVLWRRNEIDDGCPAQIAALLGTTPNSVAALAYRAREGLRRVYHEHLPSARHRECRPIVGQLAGWIRCGSNPHRLGRVTTHLDRCPDCRELAIDLTHLNHELSGVPPALVCSPGRGFFAVMIATRGRRHRHHDRSHAVRDVTESLWSPRPFMATGSRHRH